MPNDKEEALNHFIKAAESDNLVEAEGSGRNVRVRVDKIDNTGQVSEFLELPLSTLPMGRFYPNGTRISIKAATLRAIMAFSMVDNSNIYDVENKMNDMLEACVDFRNPDGSKGSYRQLRVADRYNVILEVSKLTAKSGRVLVVDAKCQEGACSNQEKVEVVTRNFVYHESDDELEDFFVPEAGYYLFPAISGKDIILAPPTIGLQKDIYAYVMTKVMTDKGVNQAFMVVMPWLLYDRHTLSMKECDVQETLLESGATLTGDEWDLVWGVINRFMFGVKELKKKCSKCGSEVRTPFTFPGGVSSLFVKQDSVKDLIRRR